MDSQTIQAIITQLGISAIFIMAWNSERIERQKTQGDAAKAIADANLKIIEIQTNAAIQLAAINARMLEMQTAHRKEILEIMRDILVSPDDRINIKRELDKYFAEKGELLPAAA